MGLYTNSEDDKEQGLYQTPPAQQQTASTPPAPDPSQALTATAEVIAGGPVGLLSESIDPTQQTSKIPFALAALGACIVGVILADHWDKKQ